MPVQCGDDAKLNTVISVLDALSQARRKCLVAQSRPFFPIRALRSSLLEEKPNAVGFLRKGRLAE